MATAVEIVEDESTTAVVSGTGNGNDAPPDDAPAPEAPTPEGEKPSLEANLQHGAVVPESKQAVSDEAKPAEPPTPPAATEDVSNGNGSGTAAESNGEAGTAVKEGEENGEIKIEEGQAGPAKAEEGKAGEEGMEVEAPPKEDLVVDYTDEFGRVRQMLQRWEDLVDFVGTPRCVFC